MNPQELADKVNEAINLWAKSSDKLVVAIDGYTGIGKTTLLNSLTELNPDIIAVNWDDFILPREIFYNKLAKAKDKSRVFEIEICDNKKLEDFVHSFRNTNTLYKIYAHDGISGKVNIPKIFDFSKKIMVIEGVFMFHPELSRSKLWDKRIYLEGDIDKIAKRRVKREKERWGKDYISETHPDSYFRQVIIALNKYVELHHPEKIADLVLEVD